MRTYNEWLKYYENATKEQVIEDIKHDNEYIEHLKERTQYLERSIARKEETIDDKQNEIVSLVTTLEKIREYINSNCDFNGTALYDKWVAGKAILQIIDKAKESDVK